MITTINARDEIEAARRAVATVNRYGGLIALPAAMEFHRRRVAIERLCGLNPARLPTENGHGRRVVPQVVADDGLGCARGVVNVILGAVAVAAVVYLVGIN